MAEQFISRGFKGRARETDSALKWIPPGQYETKDFPVLSAGPTPRMSLAAWNFSIYGEIAEDLKWTWDEFRNLPREIVTVDIHCVTKWSKLGTVWTGVSVDTLLEGINLNAQSSPGYLIAFCDGGYTTNLPLADVRGHKAWVVDEYDGRPLAPEHGGPARLLVPHLYFWKSAKWVRGFKLIREDRAGFWESPAITTTAIPGKSSDTRVIKNHGAAQMATRNGGRNSAGNAYGKESGSRRAGLDHAPCRATR